jgi:hypothetical protein
MNIWYRILIAVVAVLLLFAIVPALARVLGFGMTPDVEIIFRGCVAGIAIFYIITGRPNLAG